ncbi:chemotaxis protein CheW [bacterium]|nr:chemotaxis protein CheW [bacterium]
MSESVTIEADQYLTFKLEDEIFALGIDKVREVLEFNRVTKVPQTPDMMRGVINLRGSVVPVIDLKLKFGMGETQKSVNTCVIIVELDLDGENTLIGALADSVQEVIDLEESQIEPAPKIGTRLNNELIRGMGKRNEEFIIILEIEKVFTLSELEMLQNAAEKV